MSHRSSARWLAPLALVICAVAVYAVVRSGSGNDATIAPATTARPSTSSAHTTAKATSATKKTYTVQSGDTLSAIASKTGVALARIQALNPNVDTRALHAGQKIKLEP